MPRIEGSFENLRTALVDQKFEVDYLYPAFLTAAVPLFDSTAIRSFHWALEADKSHVQLYGEIMARINGSASPALGMRETCILCLRDVRICGGTPGWRKTVLDATICGKNLNQ